MSENSPPPLATSLLRQVLSARDRDAVLGDLIEEYALQAGVTTDHSARLWYWRQVFASIPPLLWSAARHGRWLSTLSLALGIYIVAGLLEFLIDAAVSWALVPSAAMDDVLSLVVGLLTLALGGLVGNRVRPGTARVLGAIVLIGVALLMVTMPDSVPLWYQLAFLIFGPAASCAGGTLVSRTRGTV